ncbi:MAG: pirin family protein [Calditrichaeota bacterium]|nr:MAG: pirin family protein [Calditrichota bacterium]
MKKIIHKADSRGYANHIWLEARHTFSFASYYNPERTHFGKLRVLNDDIIAPKMGFGTHPHDNMEIVTIPLRGALEHKDSMGNSSVIRQSEVQIMSAGTGILHSEFNHSPDEEINLLQIWVFPKERDIKPRYDQKVFDSSNRVNKFQTVVSAKKEDKEAVWINQDAYFSLGNFDKNLESEYKIQHKGNGAYLFVIEGKVEVDGEILEKRDGIELTDLESVKFNNLDKTEILIIEVPT